MAGRIQVIWDEVESDLVTELGSADQKQLHDLLREPQRTSSQPAGRDELDLGAVQAARDDRQALRARSD